MIFDPGSTLNAGVSRSNPKPCSKYFGSFDPFSPENVAKLEALHLKMWEFPKIGVPYLGVLIIRILLFRVPY